MIEEVFPLVGSFAAIFLLITMSRKRYVTTVIPPNPNGVQRRYGDSKLKNRNVFNTDEPLEQMEMRGVSFDQAKLQLHLPSRAIGIEMLDPYFVAEHANLKKNPFHKVNSYQSRK